jgi:hypothetical protein
VPARAATSDDHHQGATLTTATRTRAKASALAGLAEREDAWAKAKAEASRLGSELGDKVRHAQTLHDERQRLTHHEPGLIDHQGNPTDAKDNPVAAIDKQLAALGDLPDLQARYDHARRLEESGKQSSDDYAAAHLDAILAELEPQAEAKRDRIVAAMAMPADAASDYLGMAQRVTALNGTERGRQHRRVPALDAGSDLLKLSRDYTPPAAAHGDPMSDETTAHDEATALEHNQLLIGLLGGGEPELPTADDAAETPPDFDGGPREPAPEPDDPIRDHNRFVAEFARLTGSGGL